MRKGIVAALEEQLATDTYFAQKKEAAADDEFASLYHKVEQDKEDQEKKKEENSSDAGSSEDTGSEDEVETDPETEPVTESIRTLVYVQEGLLDNFFGSASASFIGSLAWAGISITTDTVKKVFKGVLWLFAKVISLLVSSIYMLDKYLERRRLQFSTIQKDIAKLKEAVKLLNEKEDVSDEIPQAKMSAPKIINTLKVGESVDLNRNIQELNSYIDNTVRGITEQINHEVGAVKHIISAARSSSVSLPNRIMALRPDAIGLKEGTIQGYEANSEFVAQYRSEQTLPGDVVMIATFPKDDLVEQSEIIRAYNDSSIILGMDLSNFREVGSLDYMNAAALADFVNSLETLCASCVAHESMYERIKESKVVAKGTYKGYFSFILHSPKKIKAKDTFLEEVYLKSMFVDKVYLYSMMDIHDYVAKVLVAGTRYVKNNIETLS